MKTIAIAVYTSVHALGSGRAQIHKRDIHISGIGNRSQLDDVSARIHEEGRGGDNSILHAGYDLNHQ